MAILKIIFLIKVNVINGRKFKFNIPKNWPKWPSNGTAREIKLA